MKKNYRPEIDGLRALAVIPVILFHAGFTAFNGGYVGVDVFFVISGFLITRIILNEINENTFTFMDFYERRARRIMPALFSVMFFSFIAAWFTLNSSMMKSFCQSILYVLAFISNIFFCNQGNDYFAGNSELMPLLHTWSLAVEEQFYIFFPIFLIVMIRFKKSLLFASLCIITAVSLIASEWGINNKPVFTFYMLPTRMWELTIGSLIAYLSLKDKNVLSKITQSLVACQALSLLGLILILSSIFTFSKETPFPGLTALPSTVGTALIIISANSKTLVGKLLSLKPFVFIGLLSYSAYLWHQPILAYARILSYEEIKAPTTLSLIALTFVLSYLTWKYIETPFRNKKRFTRTQIFTLTGLCSVIFFVAGGLGHYKEGFKTRYAVTKFQIQQYQSDNEIIKNQSWVPLREKSGNEKYGVANNEFDNTSWFSSSARRKILIVGNSHSKDMYNVLTNSEKITESYEIARYGLQIADLLDRQHEIYQSPNYVGAEFIMISSRFEKGELGLLKEVVESLVKDEKKVIFSATIPDFKVTGFTNLADSMFQRKYAREYKKGLPAAKVAESINKEFYRRYAHLCESDSFKEQLEIFEDIKNQHSQRNISIVNLSELLFNHDDNICFAMNSNFEKFFYDRWGHLSYPATLYIAKRIDEKEWLLHQ